MEYQSFQPEAFTHSKWWWFQHITQFSFCQDSSILCFSENKLFNPYCL
jgi:hypothetical protein